MRTVERIAAFAAAVMTGCLAGTLALIAWETRGALQRALREPPPAEVPAGQVVRRLELRLSEPLDKGRGDRYRVFECREVPRQ